MIMSTATDRFVANTREKSILSLRSAYGVYVSIASVLWEKLVDSVSGERQAKGSPDWDMQGCVPGSQSDN